MTVAHSVRKLVRRLGIDVSHYNPIQSEDARLRRLLDLHAIDLVVDVGANDGGYGRLLRRAGYAGEILSFEPLSEEHARLARLASADRNWHIAPRCCLGADNGTVTINVAGNSVSSSVLPMAWAHEEAAPSSRPVRTEAVPMRRLDDIDHPSLRRARRILLKVDTQGYEMNVLRGGEALVGRATGLQLELSTVELYSGQPLYREVIQWVELRGFAVWAFIPGFRDPATGRMLQMDGLFFR